MARIDQHIARLKARNYQWPIPWMAVEALARSEDCRLVAYLCSAGVPTIGWGETEHVTLGMRWTEDQVDARYYQQVVKFAAAVESMLARPATANQLGAMTMLAYNIGLRQDKPRKRGLYHTTVRRLHNAGDSAGAARAFTLLNQAADPITGKLVVLPGLTARRMMEAALYLKPDDGAPVERMPQAVQAESSLAQSPLVKLGVSAIGSGGLVGVSAVDPASPAPTAPVAASAADQLAQAGQMAAQAADTASTLGTLSGYVNASVQAVAGVLHLPPKVVLALALVAIGGGVIYWRRRQRLQGFA